MASSSKKPQQTETSFPDPPITSPAEDLVRTFLNLRARAADLRRQAAEKERQAEELLKKNPVLGNVLGTIRTADRPPTENEARREKAAARRERKRKKAEKTASDMDTEEEESEEARARKAREKEARREGIVQPRKTGQSPPRDVLRRRGFEA
jgi:hypothetical protein